jgi:pyridoxamine 5'-phosphate oxidase
MSVYDRRRDYRGGSLDEHVVHPDPVTQFRDWFELATEDGRIDEPNAMALATAAPHGMPSVRMVLLRELSDHGFVFYTNYDSRKGHELDANAHCALLFYWGPLERQVRIEGRAERLGPDESDRYFASRPHGSKLGALASAQSSVIPDRASLEAKVEDLARQYPGDAPVPRPHNWGGFIIHPESFEFWQGGPSRLHDRIRYRRGDDGWTIDRLSP